MKHISGFFRNEPCVYSHSIFQNAATIYRATKLILPTEVTKLSPAEPTKELPTEPQSRSSAKAAKLREQKSYPDLLAVASSEAVNASDLAASMPTIKFNTVNEKRLSLSLVFQTLKCE